MGKGDPRKQKHKSLTKPKTKPKVNMLGEGRAQPETVIYLPGSKEYETAFEKIYGKKGPPDISNIQSYPSDASAQVSTLPQPVLDMLGRKIKVTEPPLRLPENPQEHKVPEKDKRRVTLLRDTKVKVGYPTNLWLGVYISGPPWDSHGFPEIFGRADCYKVPTPEEADFVLFTGGPDVNPKLYGQKPHNQTKFDNTRDLEDIAIWNICHEKGIPMVGVCRGAQLLHVLNGGKLYQHVDGHNEKHYIWDTVHKETIESVSSCHHQMVIDNSENPNFKILAITGKSTTRWRNNKDVEHGNRHKDIEAFMYRDTCSIGVQGHPEYQGFPMFTSWFLKLIEECITMNPDLEYPVIGPDDQRGNAKRLKSEILMERDLRARVRKKVRTSPK